MGRGPSYPYVGLDEAIGQARKVYDYAKRGPAAVESVVTEGLKYSATSSSGQKVLAALRSFGLIEDTPGSNGKSIKLTQRAIRILLDDQNSTERQEEIRNAAISPKWYEYCWKKWGTEMPPAMRSNLLIDHGFVESTVDGFIKDYKATIAFAGLLESPAAPKNQESAKESNHSFKIGDWVQWESQGVLRMPAAKKLANYSPDGDFAFVEDSPTGIPIGELIQADPPEIDESFKPQNIFVPAVLKPVVRAEGAKMQVETFALPEGVTGQLQWPSEMSAEAYEDFVYQLEGLKKRVNRAVRKDSQAAPDLPSDNEGR
jgi:hypothetical protein